MAQVSLALEDQMVFPESKVFRACKDHQGPFFLGPKVRGVHLATQVFRASQVNLVAQVKNATLLFQDPMEM